MTRLVDTHCHLHDAKFDADREEVLARALSELDWLVAVGGSAGENRAAVALTRERVFAAVGFHPYSATDVDAAALDTLRQLAGQPSVVAIGEIGLDYYNEFSPRADQKVAFPAQLELAVALALPVVIHNREADEDCLAILDDYAGALPACIMHCFGSDAACAERCVALGCHVSFAGNLSYPKAQKLRDAALAVPLDRLLVETDAPYLSPQPRRGRRCEPHYVAHTAQVLAEIKDVPVAEIAAVTSSNAETAYALHPGKGTGILTKKQSGKHGE